MQNTTKTEKMPENFFPYSHSHRANSYKASIHSKIESNDKI